MSERTYHVLFLCTAPTPLHHGRGEVIMSLPRRIVAEGLGTAFLLAVVIGSGIMGERLAGGNIALALLANSPRPVAAWSCSSWSLAPVSGRISTRR